MLASTDAGRRGVKYPRPTLRRVTRASSPEGAFAVAYWSVLAALLATPSKRTPVAPVARRQRRVEAQSLPSQRPPVSLCGLGARLAKKLTPPAVGGQRTLRKGKLCPIRRGRPPEGAYSQVAVRPIGMRVMFPGTARPTHPVTTRAAWETTV